MSFNQGVTLLFAGTATVIVVAWVIGESQPLSALLTAAVGGLSKGINAVKNVGQGYTMSAGS